MSITPLILGSGRSGHAIAKSIACLQILRPELNLQTPVWLDRNSNLKYERTKFKKAILCIATPHALHSKTIIEAENSKFDGIICEKPACVNLQQLEELKKIATPTAILHAYRQTWGIQTIKKMIDNNNFGEIISIEGRYWQPSSAIRALDETSLNKLTWKDDKMLAGEYDTYIDLATHWIEAVSFLLNSAPIKIRGWKSHANSVSPSSQFRDSHVHLNLTYSNKTTSLGSISKTVHGSTNHFEINILGTKQTATLIFEKPDEIKIGEGRDCKYIYRTNQDIGSQQPPFHSTGWLEGYIEIISQLINDSFCLKVIDKDNNKNYKYPTLIFNLKVLDSMFKIQWDS